MNSFTCPHSSAPVLSIQCNWNDILLKPCNAADVWVSSKFQGENSFTGKIVCSGRGNSITASEGFEAHWTSDPHGIEVHHTKSNCKTVFVAPGSQFSGIHKKSIVSLHATLGGLAVSVCSENQLQVWDTQTGLTRRTLQGHLGDVYKCRFFPSGVVILTGGADMQLKIWSAETGQCPVTLQGHAAPVMDFSIVDRGRNVISVSKDGTARLWDCGESSCLGIVAQLPSIINCCTIMAVSNKVPLGERDEAASDREIGTENKVLILGCENGIVSSVSIWSRKNLGQKSMPSAVNCVVVINEETFAVGCQNGQVFLLSILNIEQPVQAWFESSSSALSLMRYSEGLFVGRSDGTCTLFPLVDSNESPKRLQLTGPEYDPIYDITCDGTSIYTACRDGVVRKYNVKKLLCHLFS